MAQAWWWALQGENEKRSGANRIVFLFGDLDAHASRRSFDNLDCLANIACVQIGQFDPGNVGNLSPTDLAHFLALRGAGAFLQAGRLLKQERGRRRFDNKTEGAVLVDRQEYRQDNAWLIFSLLVELRDELANIDTLGTEGGSDGRCRSGLAARHLQFYGGFNLLGHATVSLIR